jgi:hypothetical protein
MRSFLQNLVLSVSFGASWVVAAIAVACLGLWLIGLAGGGAPSATTAQPGQTLPRGATAMR